MKKRLFILMAALIAFGIGYAQTDKMSGKQTDGSVYKTDNELQQNKNADLKNQNVVKSVSLPFVESFDATTFPPTGWSLVSTTGGTTNFRRSEWDYHTPPAGAYIGDLTGSTARDQWMITPAIQLPGVGEAQLMFWHTFTRSWAYGNMAITISAGSNDPTSGDFVVLKTWTSSEFNDQQNQWR